MTEKQGVWTGWKKMDIEARKKLLYSLGVNTQKLTHEFVMGLSSDQAEKFSYAIFLRKLYEGRASDLAKRTGVQEGMMRLLDAARMLPRGKPHRSGPKPSKRRGRRKRPGK